MFSVFRLKRFILLHLNSNISLKNFLIIIINNQKAISKSKLSKNNLNEKENMNDIPRDHAFFKIIVR